MSYQFPPKGQWTQPNTGDANGSIWSSFNLDLTVKHGDVKITRLLTYASDSSTLANLGVPVGFVRADIASGTNNAPWVTVAGARVFKAGNYPSLTFSQDSASGTPTTCSYANSDLANFNGYLYVTTNTNAVYKVQGTGAWNASFNAGASDSNPHLLCQYANRMYMSRAGSNIISWDTADTVSTTGQYTLQLNNTNENFITCMRAASDKIWITTTNILGSTCKVFAWDGSSGNPIPYRIASTGIVSCVVKDDIPYVMDNKGRLLKFNGSAFVKVAQLPNYLKIDFISGQNPSNDRWIHPNGMAVVNDRINILLKSNRAYDAGTTTEEPCPSGVWEYDEDIGLYHKYSVSYMDKSSGTITDYGQSKLSSVGGLAYAPTFGTSSTNNASLLAGVQYYTDASSTRYAVLFDDNASSYLHAGYLVTSKIPSSGIIDTWQEFILKYNNLTNASNKIVAKYRLTDADPIEATITWTSTTTFTTTTDPTAYWTSGTGGEVEIIQGKGAGMCSHITSITNNAGTYTVTVDETHTGCTSGTAIARFQQWIKIDSITDVTSTFDRMGLPSSADSNFIQMKIWMLMYGADEVKELDIKSVVSQEL